jgi:hypothetical protein
MAVKFATELDGPAFLERYNADPEGYATFVK